MLITNALIFAGTILIVLLLRCFLKSLYKKPEKKVCNFKISNPKFYEKGDKQVAKFSVSLKDKNQFFIDFPLAFRFYGNTRFKAKVKIKYEALKSGRNPEEIIDKVIKFESKTIESIRRINDIIIGEIEIEIELATYYGSPIIEFEILKNQYCDLRRPFKKVIKFTKKD